MPAPRPPALDAPTPVAPTASLPPHEVRRTPESPVGTGGPPLRFEANYGQADPRVHFLARLPGATLFLTADEAVWATPGGAARLRLLDANPAAAARGEHALRGTVRYYRPYQPGLAPDQEATTAPSYGRVRYRDVYPGVDLVYYGVDDGTRQCLEYDFVVRPGADPQCIRLAFPDAAHVALDPDGALVLRTAGGELRQERPTLYQTIAGTRRPVPGRYALRADRTVEFDVGPYDHARPLVIDPVVAYSTYLSGANADQVWDVKVDAAGSVYITGSTTSPDFPVVNSVQEFTGSRNIFVTKLAPDGRSLVYSTLLGQGHGSGDVGNGIALDADGGAVVAGHISVPLMFENVPVGTAQRAAVAKLNPDGSLAFFRRMVDSDSGDEFPSAVALDGEGNIYIVGQAGYGLPVVNGFESRSDVFGRGFLVVLDPSAETVLYSTYIGTGITTANGLALDANGCAYVTGRTNGLTTTPGAFQREFGGDADAFVVKIDPRQAGDASLIYATYLGGGDWDAGNAILVDSQGLVAVTGETRSNHGISQHGFPVTPGALQPDLTVRFYSDWHCHGGTAVVFCTDTFVAVLSPDGSQLLYSTYLGGSGPDVARAIVLDPAGRLHLTGQVCGFLPVTPDAPQPTAGTCGTAFLATLDLGQSGPAQLVFSTFLGGAGGDIGQGIAVDAQGNVYVGGSTTSTDFPLVTPIMNLGGGNAPSVFVTKFAFDGVAPSATAAGAADVAASAVAGATQSRTPARRPALPLTP